MSRQKWQDAKLGDFLEVKHGFAFKGAFFGDAGTHVVLTPGNFYDHGGFKDKGTGEKWYSGSIPAEYVLREGSVVVAMTEQAEGLLGSSAMIPRSGLYLHNQRIGLLQFKDEASSNPRFFYYLFNCPWVRTQIRASATGAKIRHTAPGRIAEVNVRVPDPWQQDRIAALLSAYDGLVSNNLSRIHVLEESAQAIYREWFVHFRFPGHQGAVGVDSQSRSIPEGWKVAPLGRVAAVNRAQIAPRNAPDDLNYIDISSVSPGRIDSVVTYAFADAPGRARRIVAHGDILWSCVRPNRRSHALVLNPRPDTIASTGFAVITAQAVPYTFLYLATTTDEFVAYLTNHATGAAYPAVTAATFEQAELVVPPAPLLKKFGALTTPMVEQVNMLQRQITNLRATRDLLLPRLMSGRLTLPEAEMAVP